MTDLRQLLREYLELDETTIEDFVIEFEDDWKKYIASKTTDRKAADILETLLGTPNWIKEKEAR